MRVDLLAVGADLIGRSEARCLMYGLGQYREVVVDFAGVVSVGEGFVDELFRVWAENHPDTELVPVNMAEPVQALVRRARGEEE